MYLHVKKTLFFVLLFVTLAACGEIRFSQVTPGTETFHPDTICVLPVETDAFPDAKGVVGPLIADAVGKKGYFSGVVSPKDTRKLMENDDKLAKAMSDYLEKLKKVSFSDSDISKYIGKRCDTDAILVVEVDFWNYTTRGEDKLAKVGFSMELIEAQTGKIMWRAKHYDTEGYKWFKPDLADLANKVADKMISRMPH